MKVGGAMTISPLEVSQLKGGNCDYFPFVLTIVSCGK